VNNVFDLLDKYKFGLLAALLTYVGIFAYFQIGTFDKVKELYNPFHDGPLIEIPEEEIMLQPENIMLPANYRPSDVKNTARDANDKRERSETDYSTVPTSKGALSATEFEKNLFENASGVAEREKIIKQIQERHEREQNDKTSGDPKNPGTSGSDKAAAGDVMVEYYVGGRGPHNGNEYNVRNPGYTCGAGSEGKIVMNVRVDTGGAVISATYDPTKSSGQINPCMIEKAKKYALLSRFTFDGSAPKSQAGWIAYTFVSQ
jgi:hypothetical protein